MSLIKAVSAADSGGNDPQKGKGRPRADDPENEKKSHWKVLPGTLRSSSLLEHSVNQKINPPLFTNKSSRILPGRKKASGGMPVPEQLYKLQAKLLQKLNTQRVQLLRKVPPQGVSVSSESMSKVKRAKAAQEANLGPKRKRQ